MCSIDLLRKSRKFMEHSLNPILHVVNPKVYEGKFIPYTCTDRVKQDYITAKDPCPPRHFLYLR